MTDFREEAYILEKMEISEDEDDGTFQYEEIKDGSEIDVSGGKIDINYDIKDDEEEDNDDDLNDFEALKAKTTFK